MRRSIGLAGVTMLLAVGSPASGHNLTPSPTRVLELGAVSNGTAVEVGGTATFGGQRLLTIGTDPAGDFHSSDLPPNPYDLIEAKIGQLDVATGTLTFVLKVTDLPATGGVPEVARYTWDIGIDMGGENPVLLQIDGKFTDVIRNQATTTPAFQLRGNCAPDPNASNVIVCEKIADLTAEMIGADNEIFIDVPKAILEQQAKGSIDGRPIVPASIFEGIVAIPSAYFSAGGTGDTLTPDEETGTYSVAYRRVRATLAPAGGGSARTVEATLGSDGSFTASIDTAGLASGSYEVTAQACYGTNCGTMAVPVTI